MCVCQFLACSKRPGAPLLRQAATARPRLPPGLARARSLLRIDMYKVLNMVTGWLKYLVQAPKL